METDFRDEEEEPPAFGPAALGLHRVGTVLPPRPTPSEPLQKLNARGMPARIRKKNRFIFVDDFINSSPPRSAQVKQSPKKTPKITVKLPTPNSTPTRTPARTSSRSHARTPTRHASAKKQSSPTKSQRYNEKSNKEVISHISPDRASGQKIGMRLRNLLKLPKAHKWVCFEYFYSNIDKALFDGENDFVICLKESFPQLMNQKLTRVQWAKIRRIMGKPRRCSQAFFEEERKELERKRKLIRYVQQRKSADINLKDLPNEIPMQLVVGTKVTARLRKPQDGLFTGCVNAVDTSNNTYRITFERPKLGTHSVPDYEVLSNEPPDTICLSAITHNFRPRYIMQEIINLYQPHTPKQSNDDFQNADNDQKEGTVGGFPFQLLELIVKLSKILDVKKTKINKLKECNATAEKYKSLGDVLPDEFEKKYAEIVISLERMNMDLQECINEIQVHCVKIAPGPSLAAMIAPNQMKDKFHEEASMLVLKNNNGVVQDTTLLELITDLTALMLQVKSLSDSDQNAYELGVLQGTMNEIKVKLNPQHQTVFQNYIEIHMHRIQMGLGQPTT